MTGIKVAIIGGGANCEHEVSLASAESVARALDPRTYDIVRLTIDRSGSWHDHQAEIGLAAAVATLTSCDVAVPMVHGPRGEDGTLAALLDLIGIAYVGSGVRAGALAMDKWATKLIAEALGIPTAPAVLLTTATAPGYEWTAPVIVKPVAAGSSKGVALVSTADELPAALAGALTFDDRILVEQLVSGREIDLAVLATASGEHTVSPALEIVVEGVFDYATKYGGDAQFQVPALLEPAEQKALEAAAVAMYDALGCRGVARVDFFLTAGGPVLNEVNTTPGFTAQSQVPRMFAAAGVRYSELLDLLLRTALSGC